MKSNGTPGLSASKTRVETLRLSKNETGWEIQLGGDLIILTNKCAGDMARKILAAE